jgi:CofD-related protein of GAK system
MRISLTRNISIPDRIKLARFQKAPELGPRILFFSGGTALRSLSRTLINATHNSIHIITPFDSGGSSAELRRVFNMPAVGDIRNRLMALADQSVKGHPEIYTLFSHRLPHLADQAALKEEFQAFVRGQHPNVANVPDPMRKIIKHHLEFFAREMPDDFDLRGASLGNLVLTAGYLENQRHLDPVIFIYSKLVEVRGTVRPVVNRDAHLAAELADGQWVIGQHLLTGKGSPALKSAIKAMNLVKSLQDPEPIQVGIRDKVKALIQSADLICYPMGSFYTSLLANLMPQGVARAVAETKCPKVYIPNTFEDPECKGLDLQGQVERLLVQLLGRDYALEDCSRVLNFILVDEEAQRYARGIPTEFIKKRGIDILQTRLVTDRGGDRINPRVLADILLSLSV